MNTNADAYWSRPWELAIRTDDFSATVMFNTYAEAVAYVAQQSARAPFRHGRYSTFRATATGEGRTVHWHLGDVIDRSLLPDR